MDQDKLQGLRAIAIQLSDFGRSEAAFIVNRRPVGDIRATGSARPENVREAYAAWDRLTSPEDDRRLDN